MQASSDNTVTGNDLNGNLDGIAVGEELLPSNRNLIESNRIVDGLGTGVSVIDSVDNQILYNEIRDAQGGGIMLDLARNTLIRGNDLAGSKDGISLGESSNNNIESNNASGTLGTGIEVGSLSVSNKVLNNTASTNGGDGITVEGAAPLNQGTMIDGNTADGNGGDGICVEGVGHTDQGQHRPLQRRLRHLRDRRARPAERQQLRGGEPRGAPVHRRHLRDRPGAGSARGLDRRRPRRRAAGRADDRASLGISNSRNASFTYNAKDNVDQIIDIVFECRIDTTDDLMWEDCEYPQEYINLAPGQHTFQIRAIDKQLFASEPVSYKWTYQPLPANVAPITEITMGAGDVDANGNLIRDAQGNPMTWLPEAIFTYEANEPDVNFECAVDFPLFPYEPCTLQEGLIPAPFGGWEVALEENQFGLHTFYVRAYDGEGNVGQPAEYTWRLLGIDTIFTAGPGFTPGETPFDPATGGPSLSRTAVDRLRGEHRRRDLRVLARPRTVRDLHPAGHLHEPDHRRPQPARARDGHRARRRRDRSGGGRRVRVERRALARQRAAEHDPRADAGEQLGLRRCSSSPARTTSRRRACSLFQCRVYNVGETPNELESWRECLSPFNLLDNNGLFGGGYTLQDPEMAPGPKVFEVRAVDDTEPVDPGSPSEGHRRSHAGPLGVDDGGRHRAAGHGHRQRARGQLQGRSGRVRVPVLRRRQPDPAARADLRVPGRRPRDARHGARHVGALRDAVLDGRARAGRAHVPRSVDRPRVQRRRVARHAHLDDRADADHDDPLRPGRAGRGLRDPARAPRHDRQCGLRLQVEPARLDVPVLAGRGRRQRA